MVFTAFHFLSVAWAKFKAEDRIDIATLFLSTTLIDIEPLLGIFTGTYHGILHSFLGSMIFSFFLATAILILNKRIFPLSNSFDDFIGLKAGRQYEYRQIVLTSMFGSLSHVTTDAFTHRNFAYVFFPFRAQANPFWQGIELGRAVQVITFLVSRVSCFLLLRSWSSRLSGPLVQQSSNGATHGSRTHDSESRSHKIAGWQSSIWSWKDHPRSYIAALHIVL